MNGIRAYNMNLNELIRNDDRDQVQDQRPVSTGFKNFPKADNDDGGALNRVNDALSVEVIISPIWQSVADKIELKNASSDEVASLSSSLFEAGAISFEDHIQLSFTDGAGANERTDYIAYWKDRQEEAIRQGAVHEELNDIIRIQSILSYVDNLRQ